MNKKNKNMIKKALKIATFLAMIAGIVWINALKLQDETLSNYEKITDVETKDYYTNPITPVIAALFYEDKNAGYGYSLKSNNSISRKENIRMSVVPKEVNSFNRPVIEKLYEEIPNKSKFKEIFIIFAEEKNAKAHSELIKRKFPGAKITRIKIGKKNSVDENEISAHLKDNTKLVVFLANLDRGLNSTKSDRLANVAVFFAQKNNYQMNVFDIVDEYIATALATGEDYIYDMNRAGDTDSLAKQKENLERFLLRHRAEILHYFALNLERSMQKKNVELPEKTNKNYRLFDRGAVYIKVHNKDYNQVFEELKLNQDESIISVIANSTKHIVESSRGLSGKYFHIYLLTEMEQIRAKSGEVMMNYIEPDDGLYVSYKKQAGLLLASDRPSDADGIIAKLRSAAQIRDNVKNSDLAIYRFKYVEIQYEN